MHGKNVRAVDLNLLVVLYALLEEVSVSRAAERLFLSQPAVSHALDRLRSLYGDPLFERVGRSMRPTARAEALRAELEQWVELTGQVINPPEVELARLDQTVTLALADYPCALLLPLVLPELARQAPKLRLVCRDWSDGSREMERLSRGDIDLALSVMEDVSDDIERVLVGYDGMVGVSRRGHPLGSRPGLAAFCATPQIIVSAVGAERTEFDEWLAERGARRTVAVTVASFLAVPELVARSDAIALLPTSLAENWAPAQGLQRFVSPVPVPYFDVHLAWRRRDAGNPGIALVRDTLVRVTRAHVAQSAPRQRRATGKVRRGGGARGLPRTRAARA